MSLWREEGGGSSRVATEEVLLRIASNGEGLRTKSMLDESTR